MLLFATMEHKQVPVASVRGIDAVDGIVEAIVSVTNIVDSVNDVIQPGAYKTTLKKRNPKVVWSHDTNIPVGKTLKVEELLPGDTRLPIDLLEKDAGALLVKMQFNLNTSRGKDAFYDVQFFGSEQEWSIGYSVPEGKSTMDQKSGIRYISSLELYEYSPVIFGAAPHTRTLSLKDDMSDMEASVLEMQDEKAAYSDIDFSIPEGVKKQAQIGLDWSNEFNRGGTEVGKNTAHYLLNNDTVSPSKARHIARYFPRHEVDLSTPANSKPGAEGYPGAGLIAWKLWGGDQGRRWSQKLVDAMNRRDGVKAATSSFKVGDFVFWRASGGRAFGKIEKVVRDGEINVPNSSFTITGTPDDPAALIRIYRQEGVDFVPTEVRVGHKFSTLEKVEGGKDIYTDMPEGTPTRFGTPQRIGVVRRRRRGSTPEGKPYRVTRNGGGCSGYAVMKEGENSPVPGGCHDTLADARRHMSALYAAEAGAKSDMGEQDVILNGRQEAMVKNSEAIVEAFGKWNQSSMADGAHYFPADKNPFVEEGVYCGNCVFYEGGQRCHLVDGQVEAMGLCKLWVIEETLINEPKAIIKSDEVEEVKDAGANGRVIPVHHTEVNMTRPWDKTPPFSRMKSPATPSYYDKIFAYQNPNTKGDRKTHYNFIHHYVDTDGTPGAASWSAISSAMAVLNGGRAGTVLRGEARRGVYNHLAGHYKDAGKPVPELKSDEFVDFMMIKNGIISAPLTPDDGMEVKAAGKPIPSHTTPVSDRAVLDRQAILSVTSPSDYNYYKKIFAYQLPNTDGTKKTHYTFIHHFVGDDGRPGAAAMSELGAEMAVLNGARGGTILRGEDRKAVYNHLAHHYRDFGKKPPELKSDQYLDNIMMQKGLISEPLSIMESTDEQD